MPGSRSRRTTTGIGSGNLGESGVGLTRAIRDPVRIDLSPAGTSTHEGTPWTIREAVAPGSVQVAPTLNLGFAGLDPSANPFS